MPASLVVTCEHAGNKIPGRYRPLFSPHARLLTTHRGFDPGALDLARELAACFRAPLYFTKVSRLLVDTNRSLGHRGLWSPIGRGLSAAEKERVLAAYYHPFREAVRHEIARALHAGGEILHLSVHTFAPSLRGQVRHTDVGLLYDPGRALERRLARAWAAALARERPGLRVRFNSPYRGRADGHVTALRRVFPPERYVGLELEVNQRFLRPRPSAWVQLRQALGRSLVVALQALRR
jgi:predicted N-formylglutamate amidohydrolase